MQTFGHFQVFVGPSKDKLHRQHS